VRSRITSRYGLRFTVYGFPRLSLRPLRPCVPASLCDPSGLPRTARRSRSREAGSRSRPSEQTDSHGSMAMAAIQPSSPPTSHQPASQSTQKLEPHCLPFAHIAPHAQSAYPACVPRVRTPYHPTFLAALLIGARSQFAARSSQS
jgi:hypothetical protein